MGTNTWQSRFAAWQASAHAVNARADRITNALLARARQAARDAGLDPELLGIHPHNAMCAYKAGKPWPNVDYSIVRKCLWLQRRAWEPARIAKRINQRTYSELMKPEECLS